MSKVMITIIFIFITLIFLRILYYVMTLKEKKIKIIKKYKINVNNKEVLKLFDEDKIEYYLHEDLLITKKKCNELWNIIKERNIYTIRYYGMNIPNINIHFRIINII